MHPNPTSSPDNFANIFSRIGQLTRLLRDSMVNLGLDRTIMDAAEAIPDARERLNYVAAKTSEAAERVLNSVEQARPLQETLGDNAQALSARWDQWFENPVELPIARELVVDTREFLSQSSTLSRQTNNHLMEIMMAQDFQDLTGQVIQRMMTLITSVEKELIQVLVENMPTEQVNTVHQNDTLKNGPQIDQTKAGIVASQDQVDDLLDSLGF